MIRALAIAVLVTACGSRGAFECATSAQCTRGDAIGVCIQNACAFEDPACAGGYRFEANASGALAGMCTVAVDAGGSASCGGIGEACCATAPACNDSRCVSGTCTACEAEIALGRRFTCVLRADHTIWCAGDNSSGQLGLGIAGVASATRIQVRASDTSLITDAIAVSAGREHACAVRTGGTVWCWGANNDGQIGNAATFPTTGNLPSIPAAVQVVKTGGAPLTDIVQVEAGYEWTCARDSSGGVWCWGDNGRGQLGDNTTTRRSTAAAVLATAGTNPLTGATKLLVGADMACAEGASGLVCWGANTNAQFADGTKLNHLRPFAMTATGTIASGQYHSCFLQTDSSVTCAGWSGHARLADGTIGFYDDTDVTMPRAVTRADGSPFTGVKALVAGAVTCALMTDSSMQCWGDSTHGQSGNGGAKFPQPVQFRDGTPLTNVDRMLAKFAHTCAHRTSGEWLCWGRNGQGDLADGSFVNRGFPIPLKGACP
ncbi:MAG TPA: hypothetical protein VMZ53_31870 [Kofleriaceae bacterium]|nr:hypothetical protein [Kofleriaceae bacterium]